MKKELFDAFKKIYENLKSQKDYLNELDNKIGDGDHGTNMVRGFALAMDEIEINYSVHEWFNKLGKTLLAKVGGASGPLYGMAFIKGSTNLKEDFSIEDFKNFITDGKNAIQDLGGAKLKDKTMIDVWTPTLNIITKDKDLNNIENDLKECALSTKDLLAKKGRASYLGKRSIGTVDPGAFSSYIILSELAKASLC